VGGARLLARPHVVHVLQAGWAGERGGGEPWVVERTRAEMQKHSSSRRQRTCTKCTIRL